MKKIYAECGAYYTNVAQNELVRVISKATDVNEQNPVIIFAFVGEGGIVSEARYMSENEFISKYVL